MSVLLAPQTPIVMTILMVIRAITGSVFIVLETVTAFNITFLTVVFLITFEKNR